MKLIQLITVLFICMFLNSCALFFNRSADVHATQFIGKTSRQCGDVKHGAVSTEVENCIFQSLEENIPFYAWYWLKPIDSVPAAGLLFNENKELFIAWYDSGYSFWGSNFKTTKCSSWQVEHVISKRKLLCNIPESEKVFLFDLKSFVEIQND